MPYTYKIQPSTIDSHQTSPYWLAAFVRFKHKATFTRTKSVGNESQNASNVQNDEHIETESLYVSDDIISWNHQSTKSSPTSMLSMQLTGKTNYLAELTPGDWVCFWVFNDRSQFEKTRDLVVSGNRCNSKDDGIKFVGRVDSIRRSKSVNVSGLRTIIYNIASYGFTELNSVIYYNPIVMAKYGSSLQWMMDFGGNLNQFIVNNQKAITSSDAIPKLLRICLGFSQTDAAKGIDPKTAKDLQNKAISRAAGNIQASPNRCYRVPTRIMQWLNGYTSSLKPVPTYSDLLNVYIGIEDYSQTSAITPSEPLNNNTPKKKKLLHTEDTSENQPINQELYLPKLLPKNGVYTTGKDLSGSFLPKVLNLSGVSVWSVINTYMNSPVDEMYTAMKLGPDGYVAPSLVVRQTPKTSNFFADRFTDYECTKFSSLPRWEIDSSLIIQSDLGRSDALRYNYLHFQGYDITDGKNPTMMAGVNLSNIPPIVDIKDIERSGLRWKSQVLNANVLKTDNGQGTKGSRWNAIMADILMGGHLKYTGTVVTKGITQPICHGDNLVVDDILFHIESITNSGHLNLNGTKDFTTSFQLTDGVALHQRSGDEVTYPETTLSQIYNTDDNSTVESERETIKEKNETPERKGADDEQFV